MRFRGHRRKRIAIPAMAVPVPAMARGDRGRLRGLSWRFRRPLVEIPVEMAGPTSNSISPLESTREQGFVNSPADPCYQNGPRTWEQGPPLTGSPPAGPSPTDWGILGTGKMHSCPDSESYT